MAEELHVLPHPPTGGWILNIGGPWYATLVEAEQAARRRENVDVYVHDRYHRVRALAQV